MLACGCAWLRSRFAPLTAAAASLSERCRLRRNVGLCLTRGMLGLWRQGTPLPPPRFLDPPCDRPLPTRSVFPGVMSSAWSIERGGRVEALIVCVATICYD